MGIFVRETKRGSGRSAVESSDRRDGSGAATSALPKPPKRRGRRDPDFVPTLILKATMSKLRKLQRLGRPPINLKYLAEACLQLAFERVTDGEVVERAARLSRSRPHN